MMFEFWLLYYTVEGWLSYMVPRYWHVLPAILAGLAAGWLLKAKYKASQN